MTEIERTLEEERREEVTRAVHRELKPLVGRDDWAEDDTAIGAQASRIADAAIESSALPLRNAQVEAVLAKLGSLEAMAQIEPDDDEYARGINMAASIIRRAIEEA